MKQAGEIEEEDFSEALVVMYSEAEPLPLQISFNEQEEGISTTTKWVQSNMVKLSQQFGVDLKGCKKEVVALMMKLDQRREKEI